MFIEIYIQRKPVKNEQENKTKIKQQRWLDSGADDYPQQT